MVVANARATAASISAAVGVRPSIPSLPSLPGSPCRPGAPRAPTPPATPGEPTTVSPGSPFSPLGPGTCEAAPGSPCGPRTKGTTAPLTTIVSRGTTSPSMTTVSGSTTALSVVGGAVVGAVEGGSVRGGGTVGRGVVVVEGGASTAGGGASAPAATPTIARPTEASRHTHPRGTTGREAVHGLAQITRCPIRTSVEVRCEGVAAATVAGAVRLASDQAEQRAKDARDEAHHRVGEHAGVGVGVLDLHDQDEHRSPTIVKATTNVNTSTMISMTERLNFAMDHSGPRSSG